jgi:hypothetical protein
VFKTNRLNDDIGLNKKRFDLYFVKPSENYVGVKYFIQNTRFIDMVMPEKKEFKTAKAYNEAVRETFYDMIEDIKPENKKYALISPSFYQNDHDACAMKMLEIGFNVAIKWNAANLKGYDAYYIGENGEVKSWFIPTQKIEKDSDSGRLKILEIPTINARGRYVTERIETGINSSKNISPVEYIQSIFSEDIPSDHPKVNKFRKLALAMNIPEDFPEVLKLALVGGTKFDRGANFQEPSTYLAPTLYALMNKTSNTQRGAVISQKVGRMFGNTKKVYEKYGTMPLILTTKEIFEAVVANDLCLDDIRDAHNMNEKRDITKNVKAKYDLIDNRDWLNYEKKAKKNVKKLSEAYEFLKAQAQAEEAEEEGEDDEDEEEEKVDDIFEEISVQINDDFIQRIHGFYENKTTVLSRILHCLKNHEKDISIDEFHQEMTRQFGYTESIGNIKSLLRNGGSGTKAKYAGYWNVRNISNIGRVYMPKIIKNILD